jgi:hypothetical protein
MIFWLVLELEISFRVITSWSILVSFRVFFEDYIFAWWNIWVSMILLLAQDPFECKWQDHSVTHHLFDLLECDCSLTLPNCQRAIFFFDTMRNSLMRHCAHLSFHNFWINRAKVIGFTRVIFCLWKSILNLFKSFFPQELWS